MVAGSITTITGLGVRAAIIIVIEAGGVPHWWLLSRLTFRLVIVIAGIRSITTNAIPIHVTTRLSTD
jgi:hypothetical protein